MATLNVSAKDVVTAQQQGQTPEQFITRQLILFQKAYGHGELPSDVPNKVPRLNILPRRGFEPDRKWMQALDAELDSQIKLGTAHRALQKDEIRRYAISHPIVTSQKLPGTTQLAYLTKLGYDGKMPATRDQAAALIEYVIQQRIENSPRRKPKPPAKKNRRAA